MNLYGDKQSDYFANARQEIAPLLPVNADRVLEIGCGYGATMAWLRSIRSIKFAAGVEIAADPAARAAAIFDKVMVGNFETMDLPFEQERFDLILVLDVLEHLVDPWTALRRLHALLAPGGLLVASLPNVSHYSVSIPLLMQGKWDYESEGILDRTHLRFFVEKTAIELITSSGLSLQKVEYVTAFPAWFGKSARWYGHKLFHRLGLAWLVNCQILISAKSANPGVL